MDYQNLFADSTSENDVFDPYNDDDDCYYYLFIHASVSPIGRLAAAHCGIIGRITKYLHAGPTAASEIDDV